MKAVIMAGGFGTRLRPLTCTIPKPMVPMVNKPMMHHIVTLLRKHNFNEIVSLLFYQPDVIRRYFGDGKEFGVQMQYMQSEADFGTAGSVRNAWGKIGSERFIVISGDVLTDFDLTAILRSHIEKKADATLVLTSVKNPLQFGVVMTDEDGMITRFLEKPSWGEVFSDTVNTGIYIIEPHVMEMIPPKSDFDFSKNLFPMMMQEGMSLHGYIANGYWRDIGNLNEYQEASIDCLEGRVNIEIAGTREGFVYSEEDSDLPQAVTKDKGLVVVGRNCRIAPAAQISHSAIGDNCTIYGGTHIHNSILWDGVTVEENVHITNSVVGYDSVLRENALISDNVFISDGVVIGKQATLHSNIKIWPKKLVEDHAVLSKSLVWEDKWLKELFTDSRITGTINIEMNPEFGAKLGTAFGAFVGAGSTVLASRDPDRASRMMKRALSCGLMSAGVGLMDLQTTPIPIVRQELRHGRAAAGFHVRKSPLDRRSLDIIFFDGEGKDLPSNKAKAVERLFFGEDYQRADFQGIGTMQFPERTTEAYRERFFATLRMDALSQSRFNVVIDYSNGIASTIFPNILGDFHCQVVTLNAYIDPSKLARTAEEFQFSQNQLSNIVTSLSYDIGFLIDAGAEKIFVTNERGDLLSDDRLLALVTNLYLESQKIQEKAVTKIAVPMSATAEVDLVAKRYGVKVVRTTNAHGGMMNATLEDEEISFVGGTKGGFIFSDFLFATDGMYSVSKILEMMAITKTRLGTLEDSLEKLVLKKTTIPCDWGAKGKVMRNAMYEAKRHEHLLVDGVKLIFDERAWVLLIPDKEFPQFHVYAEAESETRAEEIRQHYERLVVAWRDSA